MAICALVAAFLAAAPAAQAKGKKGSTRGGKYYFSVAKITLKEGIPAEVEGAVREQVIASIKEHKRILTELPGVTPDTKTEPKKFKKYLKRHRLRAFLVHLEVTMYADEIEPQPPPRPGQRLKVSIALRMFGETIPDRVLGFSGDGSSTVILEIGKKVRKRDREVANHDAIELAVAEALQRSIKELDQPPPAKPQGPKRKKK